jgi:hypothetical protein
MDKITVKRDVETPMFPGQILDSFRIGNRVTYVTKEKANLVLHEYGYVLQYKGKKAGYEIWERR